MTTLLSRDCAHYLVLIPHRDFRLPLRSWSAALFAAGMEGAWSFPWTAPLAQLKRPLASEELKYLAGLVRRRIDLNGGKLIAGPPSLTAFDKKTFVFGPVLNIEFSGTFFETAGEAILRLYSPVILGAALAQKPVPDGLPSPPSISFRAAALANMSFSPILPSKDTSLDAHDGYSFEWETGPLHWLPKK